MQFIFFKFINFLQIGQSHFALFALMESSEQFTLLLLIIHLGDNF